MTRSSVVCFCVLSVALYVIVVIDFGSNAYVEVGSSWKRIKDGNLSLWIEYGGVTGDVIAIYLDNGNDGIAELQVLLGGGPSDSLRLDVDRDDVLDTEIGLRDGTPIYIQEQCATARHLDDRSRFRPFTK